MSDRDGYCEHGRYVGGCGPDYMCQYCEDGWTREEYTAYWADINKRRRIAALSLRTFKRLVKDWNQYDGPTVEGWPYYQRAIAAGKASAWV